MTAQTQSQRNASYRQRQREKIARMEGALREIKSICCPRIGADPFAVLANVSEVAGKAL